MQKLYSYLLLLSGAFLFIIFLLIVYLSFFAESFSRHSSHSIHKASAHTISVSQRHNTFSTAYDLPINVSRKKTLSTNEKEYYYIAPAQKQTIDISIRASGSLSFKLYSQTGQVLNFSVKKENHDYTLLPKETFDSMNGCFLQIANHQEKKVSLCIKVYSKSKNKNLNKSVSNSQKDNKNSSSKSNLNQLKNNKNVSSKSNSNQLKKKKNTFSVNNSDSSKSDNQSISNSNSNRLKSDSQSISNSNSNRLKSDSQNISNSNSNHLKSDSQNISNNNSKSKNSFSSKKTSDKTKIKKNSSSRKLSTFTYGNVNLNPHFLILRVNNVYKPDFDLTKNETNISSISFYVTEPSVALYKNGKIYARSTGISILYCKDTKKNHTACMIVRVI